MIFNGTRLEPPDVAADEGDDDDEEVYWLWVQYKDDPEWLHPFGPMGESLMEDVFTVLAAREDVLRIEAEVDE